MNFCNLATLVTLYQKPHYHQVIALSHNSALFCTTWFTIYTYLHSNSIFSSLNSCLQALRKDVLFEKIFLLVKNFSRRGSVGRGSTEPFNFREGFLNLSIFGQIQLNLDVLALYFPKLRLFTSFKEILSLNIFEKFI